MLKSPLASSAAIAVLALALSLPGTAKAEESVEKCNALAAKLETKVSDQKLTGTSLEKANAFLGKMKTHCEAQQYVEAGAAGLDVLIEIDQATSS